MECAIMCCTCHTLTRSREIVLFLPLVKILQSDGSNNFILVMGKFSYYQIVIEHHELLKYIHISQPMMDIGYYLKFKLQELLLLPKMRLIEYMIL